MNRKTNGYPVTRTALITGALAVCAAFGVRSYLDGNYIGPEAAAVRQLRQVPVSAAPADLVPVAEEPPELLTFPGFEGPIYSLYDSDIIRHTNHWNDEYSGVPGFEPLDPNLVKSMLLQESGSHTGSAYLHDPMQIANKGDHALVTLRDGLEEAVPEGGYIELHGIVPTPGHWEEYKDNKGKARKRWHWDYETAPDRITPELSIKYGIRWLFQKAFVIGEVTTVDSNSPVLEYVVRKGDSTWDIARNLGTTTSIIENYTSHIPDLNDIDVGDELLYKPAQEEIKITGMRSWKDACKRYNGNGARNYDESVLERLGNGSFQ